MQLREGPIVAAQDCILAVVALQHSLVMYDVSSDRAVCRVTHPMGLAQLSPSLVEWLLDKLMEVQRRIPCRGLHDRGACARDEGD